MFDLFSGLRFSGFTFALAGLLAGAVVIFIHLLNRRRFRTVEWAAMDFLRKALKRNRRLIRLRDWLLMLMRAIAVACFGLALAQPFFSAKSGDDEEATRAGEPMHLILLVDNSLSMGYAQLGEDTLLDQAKEKAEEIIDRLPDGCRTTVVPVASPAEAYTLDAFRTKEDAVEALETIRPVDRAASVAQSLDLALTSARAVPELSTKRVVFLGDQQRENWPAFSEDSDGVGSQLDELGDLQVVSIRAEKPSNAWVESFELQDPVADVETAARFVGKIRYEGDEPREAVQVGLWIDESGGGVSFQLADSMGSDAESQAGSSRHGSQAGSLSHGSPTLTKTIDLVPGQTAHVEFEHTFEDLPAEEGSVTLVGARLGLPADDLPADDSRFLVVPVVTSLPVVFIDQFGDEEEDPREGKLGETWPLRKWLVPVTDPEDDVRQLIQIIHRGIDELERDDLREARLVVIGGIERPGEERVELLREYLEQGGQMLITAGGDFDPEAWTEDAWRDGTGILPAPLASEPRGKTLQEMGEDAEVFRLDVDTLQQEWFAPPDADPASVRALFAALPFFKGIAADLSDEVRKELVEKETERIAEAREFLAEAAKKMLEWAELERTGELEDEQRAERADLETEVAKYRPAWLAWDDQPTLIDSDRETTELAEATLPVGIGWYLAETEESDRPAQQPFFVDRRIGHGRVTMLTTGVQSDWNILRRTDAMFVFDRMLRTLLDGTLPERNVTVADTITLDVEPEERRQRFELERPDGTVEQLTVEAMGSDRFGLIIRRPTDRGLYRLRYASDDTAVSEEDENDGSEVSGTLELKARGDRLVAVNGPATESSLELLDREGFEERMGEREKGVAWLAADQEISLDGSGIQGRSMWWWILLGVLILLLAEMLVVGAPILREQRAGE